MTNAAHQTAADALRKLLAHKCNPNQEETLFSVSMPPHYAKLVAAVVAADVECAVLRRLVASADTRLTIKHGVLDGNPAVRVAAVDEAMRKLDASPVFSFELVSAEAGVARVVAHLS